MMFSFQASVTIEAEFSCNLLVSINKTSRCHIHEDCDMILTLVSRYVLPVIQSIAISFID
jgi:hypothetical protein